MKLETYQTRPGVTVTRRPGGWPLAEYDHGYPGVHHCRSILARRARGLDPCTRVAEWRVERRRRGGYISTGYYCVVDIPDEDLPDFPCPACQSTDCRCPAPDQ